MNIIRATVKGQILIPAPLRKKFHIGKGTSLRIYDDGERIIVEPVDNDPVLEGRGMLKTKGRVLKTLMEDRLREAAR